MHASAIRTVSLSPIAFVFLGALCRRSSHFYFLSLFSLFAHSNQCCYELNVKHPVNHVRMQINNVTLLAKLIILLLLLSCWTDFQSAVSISFVSEYIITVLHYLIVLLLLLLLLFKMKPHTLKTNTPTEYTIDWQS